MKNPIIIDPQNHDFGAVLNSAVRYSLGKTEDFPSLVVNYIRPLLPELDHKTLYCMARDIDEHGSSSGILIYENVDAYGDCDDFQMWVFLLNDIRKEIDNRSTQEKKERFTEKQIIIDPHDRGFVAVLSGAILYCLGRRTYMPGLVTGYIRPLLPELDDNTLSDMERDIDRYGGQGGIEYHRDDKVYGDDCDYQTWYFFLQDIWKEQERRKQENQNKSDRK